MKQPYKTRVCGINQMTMKALNPGTSTRSTRQVYNLFQDLWNKLLGFICIGAPQEPPDTVS